MSREFTLILESMKKLIFLLVLILAAGCNKEVCPTYTDSANKMRSTIFQSGSVRADGIHRVYTDTRHRR
jgi:type III secretory pathway lipoprotein EscJ